MIYKNIMEKNYFIIFIIKIKNSLLGIGPNFHLKYN